MLIALLAALLLGGGDAEPIFDKQTRKAIKQTVTDEERKKEVLGVIKRVEKSRDRLAKAAGGARKELKRLESDRSAPVDDLHGLVDRILEARSGVHQAFVDGILEMREIMTEEEWIAVFVAGS